MTDRCCEIVDSNDCEAAPGYDAPASKLVSCWGCGRDVCRRCSAVIKYASIGGTRMRRLCFECQRDRCADSEKDVVVKKPSKQPRPRIDAAVGWASKRSGNLSRMLKEAQKNDAALFGYSMTLLDALAGLLVGVGDEAGSLYASSLARILEDKHRRARKRKSR